MKSLSLGKGRSVAIAAYRSQHFQGYAVRTHDGWVCIASLGMSWTRLLCRTMEDARTTLRASCHAGRFEIFDDIDHLVKALNKLPPFQQPAIMPSQISDIVAVPKLNAG
jgi:hypothetical protein